MIKSSCKKFLSDLKSWQKNFQDNTMIIHDSKFCLVLLYQNQVFNKSTIADFLLEYLKYSKGATLMIFQSNHAK